MIPRAIAITLGALLLAATAHVTIEATGGYGTPHSYVTMAIAAGVAGGSIFAGMAWAVGRQLLTGAFVVCIVAGEVFGFLQTANRLVAGSEATQAPLREHAEAHAKAAKRLEIAKAAVDGLPASSARLEKAEAAKKAADAAVVAKASERGCVANCRQLLEKAVDDAAAEVKAARAALDASNQTVRDELTSARTALAGMKAPESPTPLADRTGIPAWLLELFGAGVGALAANGLACCLMIFGGHHHRHPRVEIVTPLATAPDRKELAAPAASRKPRRSSRTARTPTAKDRAKQFWRECLAPEGEVDLQAIQARFMAWSAQSGSDARISGAKVGRELAGLLKESGVAVMEREGRLVAVGISLREPGRELVPM
jgi:hypothetical protein